MTDDERKLLNDALMENTHLQSFLGIDSTKEEVDMVRRTQYQNLLFLKNIDSAMFDALTLDFKKYRSFNNG